MPPGRRIFTPSPSLCKFLKPDFDPYGMRNHFTPRGTSGTSSPPKRWRVCRYICTVLFLVVLAVEGAGFHRQDLTMQIVVVGSALLIALLAVRWAGGALHKILLLYASCLFTLAIFEAALWHYPDLNPPTTEPHDSLFRFDQELGWRMLPVQRRRSRSGASTERPLRSIPPVFASGSLTPKIVRLSSL